MENCKEKSGDEEEVEITDNVEFSGIPESWTQESITVTISHPNIPEGYEIQYKIGEGEWTTGESVVIEQNGIIYGRLYNGTTDDAAAENTKNITIIDKEVPTAPTGIESSATMNSITVQASGGSDVGSGIAGYKYSTNGTSWTETIAEGESYTFSGIKAGTEVTIYARTVDNAGQTSTTYQEIVNTTGVEENVTLTSSIPEGTWTSGDVTVTLSYGSIPSGYELQYKVGSGNWTTGTSALVTANNTTVTGRLYNATLDDEIAVNSITITNIDKDVPTAPTNIESSVQISANEETATLPNGWSSAKVSKVVNEKGSVTVKASGGSDVGSGIAGYQYSTNGTSWTGTIANGSSYTFSGITGNTTIYARTVDKAGSLSGTYTNNVSMRTAPIPVDYTASQIVGENTIDGGLVIYQTTTPVTGTANSSEHINAMETYNQYVWIAVDDINDMVMCKKNKSGSVCNLQLQGEELVCTTHGYTTATKLTTENIDTTGLAGRLYAVRTTLKEIVDGNKINQTDMQFTETTKSTQTFTKDTEYREPDILSEFDQDGSNYLQVAGIVDKTAATFKKQLNEDYIEMAKSVAKYGGFYIARYEAGENGASKKNQNVLTASTSSGTNYIAGNMWYGLYNTLRNKTGVNTNVVKSHMVWRKSVGPSNTFYR